MNAAFVEHDKFMSSRINQRPKRSLSDHEKRIRFLTWLSVVVVLVVITGLFILINWSQLSAH